MSKWLWGLSIILIFAAVAGPFLAPTKLIPRNAEAPIFEKTSNKTNQNVETPERPLENIEFTSRENDYHARWRTSSPTEMENRIDEIQMMIKSRGLIEKANLGPLSIEDRQLLSELIQENGALQMLLAENVLDRAESRLEER